MVAPVRAVLLLALVAVAGAAYSCPPVSTAAIACYTGYTMSNAPSSGGACTCTCGASSSNAAEQVTFTSASTTACSAAACATKYPTACGTGVAYTSTSYTDYSTIVRQPALQTTPAVGQICYSYATTCTPNSDCNGITTGMAMGYGAWTSASDCAGTVLVLNNASNPYGLTGATICASTGCNTSPSSSAASLRGASVVLAAAAAVAAALMA